MDTESLRLFVLAAEKLNISAAGRALGLAPAAASARLAKLETTLRADLLIRSTRKVALSMEGAEFCPTPGRSSPRRAQHSRRWGWDSRLRADIALCRTQHFRAALYRPLLPEFLALHPGIKLDLRLSDAQFDLIEGSFDLALRNAVLDDSSLKVPETGR